MGFLFFGEKLVLYAADGHFREVVENCKTLCNFNRLYLIKFIN